MAGRLFRPDAQSLWTIAQAVADEARSLRDGLTSWDDFDRMEALAMREARCFGALPVRPEHARDLLEFTPAHWRESLG
jgi:hypothetical protein